MLFNDPIFIHKNSTYMCLKIVQCAHSADSPHVPIDPPLPTLQPLESMADGGGALPEWQAWKSHLPLFLQSTLNPIWAVGALLTTTKQQLTERDLG